MMAMDSAALPVSGQVRVTVTANLRAGAPNLSAPVQRKLAPGAVLPVIALVIGDTVQGNSHWYQSPGNTYLWAGACEPAGVLPLTPPSLAASALPSDLAVPNVVDLYEGDQVVSLRDAAAAGVLGIVHKATQGDKGRDSAYSLRRAAAKDAGLLWGAYHFGTAADIQAQIDNFLTWSAPDERTLVVLDFEEHAGNEMTLDDARTFLGTVAAKLGRKPAIYSGSRIKAALGHTRDTFFSGHRLWLAQYGPKPITQSSWDTYWLWQYSDGESGPGPKTVAGIIGDSKQRIDCDFFPGSAADLAAQWAG